MRCQYCHNHVDGAEAEFMYAMDLPCSTCLDEEANECTEASMKPK